MQMDPAIRSRLEAIGLDRETIEGVERGWSSAPLVYFDISGDGRNDKTYIPDTNTES